MLDIRLFRDDPDNLKRRLGNRDSALISEVDAIRARDVERRGAETQLQHLQSERNRLSKEIGGIRQRGGDSTELESRVKSIGGEMSTLQTRAAELDATFRDALLRLPNAPQEGVPVGADATSNPVLRTWGEKPDVPNPQDHLAIAARLGLFDLERATKVSGSGFVCFTGAGARLQRVLLNFLLDLHTTQHGYTEVSPPFLIRPECMVGTGQLPKFAEDMYAVDGGELFLAPTAEVPVTNLHREEILLADDLPIRYAAYTPCFRREAGATGRDNRGIIRMHQFDKVELVRVCLPEESAAQLEELTADAERVLQTLGLHYRVVELCTGDLGFSAAKTYDIEVWSPGQGTYLEVSSCSNFEDYQARRMNLRYKDAKGRNHLCHTLNGSGTALPRLYVAILEQGLQPDGRVRLPEALRGPFGAEFLGEG